MDGPCDWDKLLFWGLALEKSCITSTPIMEEIEVSSVKHLTLSKKIIITLNRREKYISP